MGANVSSPLSFMNWTLHMLASYSCVCSMAMMVLLYFVYLLRNLSYRDWKKILFSSKLLLFGDKENKITV